MPTFGPEAESPPSVDSLLVELSLELSDDGDEVSEEDCDAESDVSDLALSVAELPLDVASLAALVAELFAVSAEPSTDVQALMPSTIVPARATRLALRVIVVVMCSLNP